MIEMNKDLPLPAAGKSLAPLLRPAGGGEQGLEGSNRGNDPVWRSCRAEEKAGFSAFQCQTAQGTLS